MKKPQRIQSDGLWLKFEPEAERELELYLKSLSIENLNYSEKSKIIKKVYKFTVESARHVENQITSSSLNSIQQRFPKNIELEPIYRKVLALLLVVIEKELGIRAPELGSSTYLNQEVPQLTPDTFLNSRLANEIYDLLESKHSLHEYLKAPKENSGFLALWLCLKEAIDHQKGILKLLSSADSLLEIDKHWLFPYQQKRYWLSTKAELLLHRWYETCTSKKLMVVGVINRYLCEKGILLGEVTLSFIELRQMLKLEYIMRRSAIEYGLSTRKIDSALLPEHVLYRLLHNERVEYDTTSPPNISTTVRQSRSWDGAFSESYNGKRRNANSVEILELTTKEQLNAVSKYTNKLEKENRKTSIRIRHSLLENIRVKLEDPVTAKKMPWAWLTLSWLYHLLKNGGKHKRTLRLDTIKSYVHYVAEPFIAEFNGCNPTLMNEIDWAEKLNTVIEQIASVSKKAYVAYFAEFLIDSELVPNLCLSDIDVPAAQHNADANVITQHEADRILSALEQSSHPKAELATLCFVFGFYAGLRRNEIKGLQFKDFHQYRDSYQTLHVRPNRYRELKSKDSSRNLPLDALLPEPALIQVYDFLDRSRAKYASKDSSVFHFYGEAELNEGFSFLTKVIKGVTGDDTLRFHHCRHSFANWTVLQFYQRTLTNVEGYAFLDHPHFSNQRSDFLLERLGIEPFSRKGFWSVGEMLGHSSPATTASSYFHLADFLRRNLYANHQAELSALRLVWGQRIATDRFGRIVPKPSISQAIIATRPNPSGIKTSSDAFDIRTLEKKKVGKSLIGLGLDTYWRILSRTAEKHSPQNIAHDLNMTLDGVNTVLELEAEITARTLRNSKHRAEPNINYARLNKPNISVVKGLIKRFMSIEQQLNSEIKLSLLLPSIENLIGAKDSLLRTRDKNSALTILRFLKLMNFEPFDVSVKWYMDDIPLTEGNKLKPYLNHAEFWKKALVNNVGLPNTALSVVLPHCLNQFKRQFESIATTTLSDDGKFLAYKAPGYVSIHVKQTRFVNDMRKEPEHLPSRPRRTKAFVSFLRLLVVYLSAKQSVTNIGT